MPKIIGGVTRAWAAAPALILTSSGLTPLDATRTRTSSGAGTGRGTLRSTGSLPKPSRTTAFMASMTANLPAEQLGRCSAIGRRSVKSCCAEVAAGVDDRCMPVLRPGR